MRQVCRRRGFTLVELLVVVSVIAVLLSVIYASFSNARQSSRDSVRQSALKEIQLALETYKNQQGRYPHAGCESTPDDNASKWVTKGAVSGGSFVSCDEYIAGLVPEYLAALPVDPNRELETNFGFAYRVSVDGQSYKVLVRRTVEHNTITDFTDEFARCPYVCSGTYDCDDGAPAARQYAVYSPGAECW